ncbi:hypothetical protein JCM11251_002454 [Rhodosporidiobolus azoricus]
MLSFLATLILCTFFFLPSSLAHPDAAFHRSYDLNHPSPTSASSLPRSAARDEHKPHFARRGKCHRKKKQSQSAGSSGAWVKATPASFSAKKNNDWSTNRPHRTSTRSSSSTWSPSTAAAAPSPSPSSSFSSSGSLKGYHDPTCDASGPTDESSESGGPNGSEEWLNCGLSKAQPDAGWTPPTLSFSQLKTVTLEEALALDSSVYSNCKPYVSLFEKYADKHGLPPILLAAFAMQESSCKADTLGDAGGAFGLMQITEGQSLPNLALVPLLIPPAFRADKCGDAPDGNCSEAEYNIKIAAAYFAKTLDEQGGNLLLALGTYNGWYHGLTYNGATAAAGSDCCECQNNLDYHQQMLNGWLFGLDGSKLGTIRNLEVCSL